jgi:hypothetical protein
MIAPILAGFLYDWRPVSVFPASLMLLLPAFLLSWHYLGSRRQGKGPVDDLMEKEG